jgi:hypothetical protein
MESDAAPCFSPEERALLLARAKAYRLTWDGTCSLLGALGDDPDKSDNARRALKSYHRRKKEKAHEES